MSNDSQPVELTLYPELEENPDCIAIAERCELLAAILQRSHCTTLYLRSITFSPHPNPLPTGERE